MNVFKKLILVVLLFCVALPAQAAKRGRDDDSGDETPNAKRAKPAVVEPEAAEANTCIVC